MATDLTSKLIVVAEDSLTQAEQIKFFLESKEFRVLVGSNGKEALKIIEQNSTDLIVSDIIMPEMDGFQLCRLVKDSGTFNEIPVILLTNLDSPDDVKKGLFCGADDFLPKPFNENQLYSHIVKLLNSPGNGVDMDQFIGNVSREKILNFMISTYENLLIKSKELEKIKNELAVLNLMLEKKVIDRTTELEEVNKELESFSYSISHDLRAPLRAIIGYCGILRDDYSEKFEQEGKEAINNIINNTSKLNQFIDDILSFSRVGRKELSYEVVNMDKLIKEKYKELMVLEKGRKIKFNIENHLPDVQADISLISLVVQNILSNAIKYTSKKEVAEINIKATSTDKEITFSVEDNGAGFNENFKDKLFGVFSRLHSDREFPGTGVGLAICHRILLKHQGKIWAEGSPGKGAVFSFSLPCISLGK